MIQRYTQDVCIPFNCFNGTGMMYLDILQAVLVIKLLTQVLGWCCTNRCSRAQGSPCPAVFGNFHREKNMWASGGTKS